MTCSTFKRRERQVGLAVEEVAKKNCVEAATQEREMEIENGGAADENGLIGLTCFYYMG